MDASATERAAVSLRRTRSNLIGAVLMLGLTGCIGASAVSERSYGSASVIAVLTGVPGLNLLWRAVRPFRLVVDEDGIDAHTAAFRGTVPWTQLSALVLARLPTGPERTVAQHVLLAVPAGDSALPEPLDRTTPDGRPAATLIDLAAVRETPDQVAAALARFGPERFLDARDEIDTVSGAPDFTIGLRGYDRDVVDALIARARRAHAEGGPDAGTASVWAELTDSDIPIALRGYDREQVHAYLAKLRTDLGPGA